MSENIQVGFYNSFITEKGFSVTQMPNSSDGVETVLVPSKDIVSILEMLKTEDAASFDLLVCLTGTDMVENIELTYLLYSTVLKKKLIIKTTTDVKTLEIHSVRTVYKTADWNEREIYDLLGVKFTNHPDLKRILLPDSWIGHPLKKDYKQEDPRLVWNER